MNARGDFSSFCSQLSGFIEHALSIVYSIALLIPLFISRASVPAGFLPEFLNKWYSFLILAFMLILSVTVSSFTKRKEGKMQADLFQRNIRVNREYGYFYSLVFDYATGKYVRLYKMQSLLESKMKKILDLLKFKLQF